MNRISFIVVCLTASCTLWGNPIAATHHIYIDTEDLQVSLDGSTAKIEAHFHFRSAVAADDKFRRNAPVRLELPIWVPDHTATSNDVATKTFLKAFPSYTFIQNEKITQTETKLWKEAIDLQCYFGNQLLEPYGFGISDVHPVFAWRRHRSEFEIPGWREVVVIYDFDPSLLLGDPEVIFTYKQPLSFNRSDQASFVYKPFFDNLPAGQNTEDLSRYSMTVKDVSNTPLHHAGATYSSGSPMKLPLLHRQLILIQRKRPKNLR